MRPTGIPMSSQLFPEGDDRVPSSAALAAAIAAPFFLPLSTVGMSALREEFEGVRPLAAADGFFAPRLLGPRPMWLFLAMASVALVSASVAVTVL
jgi:hypothetical protein